MAELNKSEGGLESWWGDMASERPGQHARRQGPKPTEVARPDLEISVCGLVCKGISACTHVYKALKHTGIIVRLLVPFL